MKEFIEMFGKITLSQLIVMMIGLGWLGGWLGQWLRTIYKQVTTYHDEKEEHENFMERSKATEAKVDLLVKANLAMLSHHLFSECERLLDRGHVTIVDLENLKRLYEPYHLLGGNGTGTKLYNDVLELPLCK